MSTKHPKPTMLTYHHGMEGLFMFPVMGFFLIWVAMWFGGEWGEFTWWMGALVVLGVLLLCIRKGLQIDVSNRKWREYYSLFGLKEGKWSSLNRFAGILLLQPLPSKILTDSGMYVGKTNTDGQYEIMLANHNHLYRLSVDVFRDHETAMAAVKRLADATGFSYVRYNPKNRRPREVMYSPHLSGEQSA